MRIPDSNYLQQVAELGEVQSIICTEQIQSADGLKLLPKGARINRQVIQRLLSHKLLKPIDFTTRIEDALDHQALIALGNKMMARETEMGRLLRMMRGEGFIRLSCLRIHLETPLQNKLTVAQKLRPELLEHSLRVLLAITIIGEQLGLPEKELEVLASAGLLHDLGELHLGIGDLPLEQNLSLDHWQQVRSHPIVGAMILEQFPAYRPHVARTVREHHERLDGSGYPQGSQAIRISRAGRLLAFTELAIGALRKYSLRQLSTIIKTNLDALDPQPVSVFLDALHLSQSADQSAPTEIHKENVVTLFKLISQLVTSAESMVEAAASPLNGAEPCLLGPSIIKLQQTLRRAGFDPHQTEATLQMIGDDPGSFIELEELMREAIFQLRKTLLEMHRRRSEGVNAGQPDQAGVRQWIAEAEQNLDIAAGLLNHPTRRGG
ncbi:HD-GYP domain-containing protein [Sedimenticola sp.]|uniref:HD-GYP domain-containing protein n=1 Tax=Sedimenticola sp. TaxID=1940285 RepID=UPI003D0D7510